MSTSLFSGCSFTAGTGFELGKDAPELWVNLLHSRHPKLNKTRLLNIGFCGRSTANIFKHTVFTILAEASIKYVFVNWTSVPRYELSLGLEEYNTWQCFKPGNNFVQHNLHNIVYPAEYLKKINDRFTTLTNDHSEIVDVLYYVNAINQLCQLKNCQVFHINALCPWDNNYFTKLSNCLPNNYTNYTKKLIQTDSRDDDQVFRLYDRIHNEYNSAGGIQEHTWLNLYSSMIDQQVDVNSDKIHPGINSNQLYYQQFNQALESKLL